MLCEVHSKEFAHDPCPIINNRSGYCPCDELGRLDGQIRDFLHQALKKRQELMSRVNHFHDHLHQMPPEIVSSIFLFYVSSVPKKTPGPLPWNTPRHKSSGPLILGAVCRKWREIAWSTPQLWSSISLYLSSKSFSSNLRIAQEWLSRSGQLPLSITLFMRNHFSISMDDLLPMTHLFNKYAGRWQHLEFLSIPLSILSTLKLNNLSLQGPTILHTINKYFVGGQRWDGLSPIFQGLSPTVVGLSFVPFPSIGICWSRVTRVYVVGFSVGACIELIQHAPLLTDCRFLGVISDQEEYLPRGNAIHTSLNSLFFELTNSKMDTFLHHFSLPSLQKLHLNYGVYLNTPPTVALLSFCARSPLLKKLKLMGSVIEHDLGLVRVLSKTPALTHLYIAPHPLAVLTLRHLFTRLAESWLVGDDPCQAHEQFLPKLQCLHFSGQLSSDDLCEAFGPLSEITNPHRRPFNQLQFLLLDHDRLIRDDYEASMMTLIPLKDAGINLKVTDPSVPDKDLLEDYRSNYRQNFPNLL